MALRRREERGERFLERKGFVGGIGIIGHLFSSGGGEKKQSCGGDSWMRGEWGVEVS